MGQHRKKKNIQANTISYPVSPLVYEVAQKEYEAAVELGKKMEDMAVTIYSKAGDGGRLFGSITSKDIAEELKKQHNVEVDKRKITLDEPIRVLGSRFVDIKIHQKVTTRLRVDVKEKQ